MLAALDERARLFLESNDPVKNTKIGFCRAVATQLLNRDYYDERDLPALLFIADTMLNHQLSDDEKRKALIEKQQSLYQEKEARGGARYTAIYGDVNTVLLPIINNQVRLTKLFELASNPQYHSIAGAENKM